MTGEVPTPVHVLRFRNAEPSSCGCGDSLVAVQMATVE